MKLPFSANALKQQRPEALPTGTYVRTAWINLEHLLNSRITKSVYRRVWQPDLLLFSPAHIANAIDWSTE